jgi:predicted flap endonuclease-1-like 5' DNA nuclease
MTAKTFNPLELWSAPATATFEFWASLWPTAPLFGVEWRFADTLAQWNPLMGKPAEAKTAAPKTSNPKTAKPKAAKPGATAAEAAPMDASIDAPVAAPVAEAALEVALAAPPAVTEPAAPAALMVKAPAKADDLTVIKGVGPALARQLNGLGVYKFSQIAGFSDEDLAWIDMNLPAPRGRCFRDGWSAQAKALIA